MTNVSLSDRSSSDGSEASMGGSLGQVNRRDEEVDELDADEGGDDAADAIDEQVPAEQSRGTDGPIANAAQGERDQDHDDQPVEDHGGQHCAARIVQSHDVERAQLGESQHKDR